MNILEHNRHAWDRQVVDGNIWTIPAGPEAIAAARRGDWMIVLTPTKQVPHEWLPDLPGKRVLCLASGGGQQGPILAAAGAEVTVLDNSPRQLERDKLVAEREGLQIKTVQGDMADLYMFPNESFDYIVHPVSNVFVPNVLPVWREAFRVLVEGGVMIAGFDNPALFLFDYAEVERTGKLEVRYALPYADLDHITEDDKRKFAEEGTPFEWGHTLEDQIGGQLAAGFMLTALFEDRDPDRADTPLNNFMSPFIATRAVKPHVANRK